MARKTIRLDNQKAKATRPGGCKGDKQASRYADLRVELHRRFPRGDREALIELLADPPANCARLKGIGKV